MGTSSQEKPLVTVVVPTYNHRSCIGRCLDSILEQETDFPIRLLVLDDASTDGTSDIVREYSAKDDRVVAVIREKNLGAIANTKTEIKKLSTEFFIITEGDDYWCDPGKLQLQIDALRRNPACSCCGHATDIRDKEGKSYRRISRRIKGDEGIFDIFHAPYCHTTSMLYRNFLPSLSELEWKRMEGDAMYLMKALDIGNMVYIPKVMSVYSWTGDGIWTGLSEEDKIMEGQVNFYRIDQFLKFKYTKLFQPKYLPDMAKTIFSVSIPLWKGRHFIVKFQKSKS